MVRGFILFSLALTLLLRTCVSGFADTDAVLLESTPAAGEVLQGPDLSVYLRFSVGVGWMSSKLTLVSAEGHESAVHLIAPISDTHEFPFLRGRVTGLKPGAYRLRWSVFNVAGHPSSGEIPFSVK